MSRFARVGPVPEDFDVIEPTLTALDEELRRKSSEHVQGKRRVESNWIVHQIDWQKTRYVHDMRYKYERISQEAYDYCVRNKMINGPLSEKWFEQGYERLCSLYAIDSRNFKFGGTSICRVPRQKLGADQQNVESVFNGCRGCGSGKAGVENIFGNKYGQRLAAIQIRREQLEAEDAERRQKEEEEEELRRREEEEAKRAKKEKKDKKKKKDKNEKKDKPWAENKEEEAVALEQDENNEEEEADSSSRRSKRSRREEHDGDDQGHVDGDSAE